MTDFTDEQLEAVERAMIAAENTLNAGKDGPEKARAFVLAELRPKPKFAEGQVVAFRDNLDLRWNYGTFYSADWPDFADTRHLTLTELGPAVRKLRNEAADVIANLDALDLAGQFGSLVDAFAAFDAVHGDDNG